MTKVTYGGVAVALLTAFLVGCGGGSTGGGGGGPLPHVTPTPTIAPTSTPGVFPQAKGKPMAFANSAAVKTSSAVRRLASTRHPFDTSASPSPSPSTSPTPTPTPVPLPSPSGNPLVPTTMAVADGFNLATDAAATIEVLDATTHAVVKEAGPPTWQSARPDLIDVLNVSPWLNVPSLLNAWSVAFKYGGMAAPHHTQVAFVFPDSTGILDVYSFDGFILSQTGVSSVTLTTGTAVADSAAGDMYLDLDGIQMPNGYQWLEPVNPNIFGDPTPALHNVGSLPGFSSQGTTLLWSSICVGCTYATKDSLGGLHKFMVTFMDANSVTIYQLAADPTGTFPF